MKPLHLALAVAVAAIWGFNFVVIRAGLDHFPPMLLTVLRFLVAALPVAFLPRPVMDWRSLCLVAFVLFDGQFAGLLVGMAKGMPPGLASIAMQSQAFFTVGIAAFLLGERPGPRQLAGCGVAALGLILIGASVGGDVTAIGFALILFGAFSWACGNILLRRAGPGVGRLALVAWGSLIAAGPMLVLSWIFEGQGAIVHALAAARPAGWAAVAYLGVFASLVGFGLWGYLFKLYPAATVAPFSLLVPIFGIIGAVMVYDERFGPLRLGGMVAIVAGLALLSLPVGQRVTAKAG